MTNSKHGSRPRPGRPSTPAPGAEASPSAAQPAPAAVKRAPKKPADTVDGLGRLTRLGFSSLPECLLSIPKDYFDYTQPVATIDSSMDESARYLVLTAGERKLFKDKQPTSVWIEATRLELTCKDSRGTEVNVVIFGSLFPWLEIERGQSLHLYGFLTRWGAKLTLQKAHPVPPHARGRVIAQYAGKPGQVSGERLGQGVACAMEFIDDAEVLLLAQACLRDTEFTELTGVKEGRTLLKLLHFPRDVAQGRRAIALARKLSAETVVRRAAIAKLRPPVPGSAIVIRKSLVEELIAELPYKLTGDQRQAVDDIVKDLHSPYAMNRLLSGDVGTGKSLAFQIPAAAAYAAGAEVAILVPNQLLVKQLAEEFAKLFPGLPICKVIAGSKITDGIAIGTTALLGAAKRAKKKFNLLIVDEQHKFSVEQKESLCSKFTNRLEATATAIPRTLALVNFGGMDVSVLRECPVKKQITTRVMRPEDQSKVDAYIARTVTNKGQIAVIYPLVDDDEPGAAAKPSRDGLESVVEAAKKWEARFPGRVGVLHGKLSPEQKVDAIENMNEGRYDILVASLVIEVGVTLPSLKGIIINSPDRFGLAQLHQLRGRVARKGGQGHMLLMGDDSLEGEALERLDMLVKCSDGFQLAEADMEMRGFGDATDDSTSQTGYARTLFYNSQLSHSSIAKTAKRLGVTL